MLVTPESRKNKSAVRCGAFNGATEAQTGLAHPPNTPAARVQLSTHGRHGIVGVETSLSTLQTVYPL